MDKGAPTLRLSQSRGLRRRGKGPAPTFRESLFERVGFVASSGLVPACLACEAASLCLGMPHPPVWGFFRRRVSAFQDQGVLVFHHLFHHFAFPDLAGFGQGRRADQVMLAVHPGLHTSPLGAENAYLSMWGRKWGQLVCTIRGRE
jgi:hypothetical protein